MRRLDVQIPARLRGLPPCATGAGATDDDSFTTEQAGLLESALTDSGVDHTLVFYPARHGFAVPDNPTYNAEADARHWQALHQLYRAHLQNQNATPPV